MVNDDISKPWLLIPIETKHRELYGKIFLALTAAERGFRVLLGEQNAMLAQLENLPAGIYLDKSVGRTKLRYFERLMKQGSLIVAWCEEGLVYRDREAYLHERVSREALEMTEKFFAWGKTQASDISDQAPESVSKIEITGNPRFDMLRPELRGIFKPVADELVSKYGHYILINSNFSRYNHFMGYDSWILSLKERGTIKDNGQLEFYYRWREFLGRVFCGFVEVIPELVSAFPDRTFILRPHPSEDHDAWRRITSGLPNFKVIHDGNAIPWITGADAVIHNSCTTGLEAYLLERPVIAYRPVTDNIFDSYLPNAISHEASNGKELIDTVHSLLNGTTQPISNADKEVKRYISALDGPFAADQIADFLAKIAKTPMSSKKRLLNTMHISVTNLTLTSKPILRSMFRRGKITSYARQKFSGIKISEVQDIVTQLSNKSGRFLRTTITLSPFKNCFQIEML